MDNKGYAGWARLLKLLDLWMPNTFSLASKEAILYDIGTQRVNPAFSGLVSTPPLQVMHKNLECECT